MIRVGNSGLFFQSTVFYELGAKLIAVRIGGEMLGVELHVTHAHALEVDSAVLERALDPTELRADACQKVPVALAFELRHPVPERGELVMDSAVCARCIGRTIGRVAAQLRRERYCL